ncbi:tautomerase family protein [Rhodoferax sp.]|uniref:tautomerase family protein n=1 Tax=Rhodoferax sp. TaxID=50421 RepID=UPI002ACD2739|nr:tautomerase family protein [Rhodoferax sp.]MDZ7920174.1 tautomerase family protein [Rhodoferax sp.]
MPLVRIDIPTDTPSSTVRHVADLVHKALVSSLNIPVADRFQTITRRASDELICAEEFLGIAHSHKLLVIQIVLAPRTVELKKALFSAIANEIANHTPFKAQDVIINLIETAKENWSFGNGIAQFA